MNSFSRGPWERIGGSAACFNPQPGPLRQIQGTERKGNCRNVYWKQQARWNKSHRSYFLSSMLTAALERNSLASVCGSTSHLMRISLWTFISMGQRDKASAHFLVLA